MTAKRPLVLDSGSLAELGTSDSVAMPSLAIANGATTPNPGSKTIIWSTTESALMAWNGSSWTLVDAGGGVSFSPVEVDEVIPVKLYIPNYVAVNVLSFSGGLLLDSSSPAFADMALAASDVVFINDGTYTGVWVLGSVASPAAIPLTRHSNYPDTTVLQVGTRILAARSFPEWSSFTAGSVPGSFWLDSDMVLTAEDSIADLSFYPLASRAPGWVKFTLDSGATMPGGLSAGTWYYLSNPTSVDGVWRTVVRDATLTPVDITSVGINGGGGTIASGIFIADPVDFSATATVSFGNFPPEVPTAAFSGGTLSLFVKYFGSSSSSYPDGLEGAHSVALGSFSVSGGSAVSIGRSSMAGNASTAVGYAANAAQPTATAVGSYSSAVTDSIAIGTGASAVNPRQIAFSPAGASGFRIDQLVCDHITYPVSSYPALMVVDTASYTAGRSGIILPYGHQHCHFHGMLNLVFSNSFSTVTGTAEFEVEGWYQHLEVSPWIRLEYRVIEKYSSFPSRVTVTMSHARDGLVDYLNVYLSSTVDPAAENLSGYLYLLSRDSLVGFLDPGDGTTIAPITWPETGPRQYKVKWAIIPYAEEIQTYSGTLVGGTYPAVTLNLTHRYFTVGSTALAPALGDKVFIYNTSAYKEGIFIITDVSTPSAAVLTRVPEFADGTVLRDSLTIVVEGGGIDFFNYLIDHITFDILNVAEIDVANNILALPINLYDPIIRPLFTLVYGGGKPVWIPNNIGGETMPVGITGNTVYYAQIVAPVTANENRFYFKLYSDEACTTEINITSVNTTTDRVSLQIFTSNNGAIDFPFYLENVTRPLTIGTDMWGSAIRLRAPFALDDTIFRNGYSTFTIENVDFGVNTQIMEYSLPANYAGNWFGAYSKMTGTLLPPTDASNNSYEAAIANSYSKIVPIKIQQSAGTTEFYIVFLISSEIGISGKYNIKFDFYRDNLTEFIPIIV